MNHLAHLILAGDDVGLRVGGFLGDFTRGRLDGRHGADIERGIRLHRFIDAFTDRHPAFLTAARQFTGEYRRWAPVALDVWFDHLLARDFTTLLGIELDEFATAAYADLAAHEHLMPATAREFSVRMRERDLLGRYACADTVPAVLARLATRSPRAAPLAHIDAELERLEPALEAGFSALLPAVRHAAEDWRTGQTEQVDLSRRDH